MPNPDSPGSSMHTTIPTTCTCMSSPPVWHRMVTRLIITTSADVRKWWWTNSWVSIGRRQRKRISKQPSNTTSPLLPSSKPYWFQWAMKSIRRRKGSMSRKEEGFKRRFRCPSWSSSTNSPNRTEHATGSFGKS